MDGFEPKFFRKAERFSLVSLRPLQQSSCWLVLSRALLGGPTGS